MAVAESLRAIKDNADVIRLSEQHGVDCAQRNAINVTRDYGNYGCQGGWTDRYYDFMITEGVINYDDYYLPYNAQDNMCGHDSDLVAFKPARQG